MDLKKIQIGNYTYINLNLTVTYIAKMLGYQRETVSRSLKLLSEKEIILQKDRKFYVDTEKLGNSLRNKSRITLKILIKFLKTVIIITVFY